MNFYFVKPYKNMVVTTSIYLAYLNKKVQCIRDYLISDIIFIKYLNLYVSIQCMFRNVFSYYVKHA